MREEMNEGRFPVEPAAEAAPKQVPETHAPGSTPDVNHDALALAEKHGWPVFPCHSVVLGKCTCPDGENCEKSPGKHPRTKNGFEDAVPVSDPQVAAWIARWPAEEVNWAYATGYEVGGPDVVDQDCKPGKANGLIEFKEWQKENGRTPVTFRVQTGGGGLQDYFLAVPGLGGRNGWLPGVDFKSKGGYVMAPGSRHISGGTYVVKDMDAELAEMPSHLASALLVGKQGPSERLPETDEILKGVPEGKRDDTLFKAACRWRRQLGDNRSAVETLALTAARACDPPFPDDQAIKCVDSAFRQDHAGPMQTNDDGNALVFAEQHSDTVRYLRDIERWRVWNGMRWDSTASAAVLQKARETARSLSHLVRPATGDEADAKHPEREAKWAAASHNVSRIEAMPRLAKSDERLAATLDDFDADEMLLNCPNGIIDLRTGRLLPHNSDAMLSKLATVEYKEAAKAPEWRAWIDWAMGGDPQLVEFLQRAVGYSLTGSTDEQVLFLLHGGGANGKSTFLDAMGLMLGDYHWTAAKDLFVRKRPEAASNSIADLHGRRFVTASESRQGNVWDEETIKSLTGDDHLTARLLYSNNFEFRPTHKLWVAFNHKPTITDTTHSMWRRVLLIPWTQTVEEAQRRNGLHKELIAKEGPGIFWWAVEGALKWQEDGLQVPDVVRAQTETYKKEQDPLGKFLEEFLVSKQGSVVPVELVLDAYKNSDEAPDEWRGYKIRQQLDDRLGERRKLTYAGVQVPCWEGWGLREE